ncbi:Phage-related holin (Lysis protein) [uncultured Clostridium sp.]|nr:phage holin family protein [Coprobacillus sp.]SCJ20582.1 Phage-related holin (Lysis protein) [uncultured Clostridium sp.]
MKFMEKYFNALVAVVATFFTYVFGSWDLALQVLIVFMILDYGTGVLYAFLNNQLNSEVGFKGLVKKMMILVVLIIGVMVDRILGTGNWVFRTLVAYFYIANEGISLLENVGNIGIPIPNKLRNALEQLNKDEESE